MEKKRLWIIGLVKSNYILKVIFSLIWENKKFNLISYNKQIQKKLSVDIETFKKNCSRKIIETQEGNVREYLINSNILIFEGEYKNGKRNGKGKEYYNDQKLKFEGIYLNGKKKNGYGYDYNDNIFIAIENGNIKEYFFNGNSKFIGEYLEGKRWKGKGYNYK